MFTGRTISNDILWTWLMITTKLESEFHVSREAMLDYDRIIQLDCFESDSQSYCEEIQMMAVHPLIKYYAKQHLLEKNRIPS
jgi:hypothetical protein